MIAELDGELTKKFRSFVNSNNSYVRIYSTQNKDANAWSKICSCMDWLDVAIEGIKEPVLDRNMNKSSLNFAHFLIDIDMIIESIENLWLAFSSVFKKIKEYKSDSNEIFNAFEFGKPYTDREYFKEVRAWFGIHAVNGNSRNLPGFKNSVRFFSSWSSSHALGEYVLILYSNNQQAEKEYGGIKKVLVKDLVRLAQEYYFSLEKLMEELQKSYEVEMDTLRSDAIYLDRELSDLKKLKYLRKVSLERKITREFYEHDVERYLKFLEVDLSVYRQDDKKLILDYLGSLSPIIQNYKILLEQIDIDDDNIFELMNLKSNWYRENHYAASKALEKKENPELSCFTDDFEIRLLIGVGLPEYIQKLQGFEFSLLVYSYDNMFYKTEPPKTAFLKSTLIIDDTNDELEIITIPKIES
ncbi:hypothetical protein [Sporosarcina sp. E16_8]|uniref:hypothetical protein n=1 Tax=Sporosarcina sp. E16_8 TaxID=2789295 RepID=UPI001A925254|nr:hypothetical protein [Sporosarcina sp. E16_8]MBO0589402.1 hypothetical protein [Sporosarcina sp. E16_8]